MTGLCNIVPTTDYGYNNITKGTRIILPYWSQLRLNHYVKPATFVRIKDIWPDTSVKAEEGLFQKYELAPANSVWEVKGKTKSNNLIVRYLASSLHRGLCNHTTESQEREPSRALDRLSQNSDFLLGEALCNDNFYVMAYHKPFLREVDHPMNLNSFAFPSVFSIFPTTHKDFIDYNIQDFTCERCNGLTTSIQFIADVSKTLSLVLVKCNNCGALYVLGVSFEEPTPKTIGVIKFSSADNNLLYEPVLPKVPEKDRVPGLAYDDELNKESAATTAILTAAELI